MKKPGSAVLMTFSNDPHLGMTDGQFTGSAVVFPATVTFGALAAHREPAAISLHASIVLALFASLDGPGFFIVAPASAAAAVMMPGKGRAPLAWETGR